MSLECIVRAMPTSQFFLVHPPVDGVVDPSATAKRVSKLSLKNRRAYKRGLREMDPHVPEAAAAQKNGGGAGSSGGGHQGTCRA